MMYPIIALWSHPRSMSTATERLMRARGDLLCFHEPFIDDYYLHRTTRVIPHHRPRNDQPIAFDEVCNLLLDCAKNSPVFFKDMSYYVVPHLFERSDFFHSVTHCFLVRRPQAAIASYYRLDPEITLPEIGYESQYLHYRECLRQGLQAVVIEAENLQSDPNNRVREWWEQIDLEYTPSAFNWSDDPPADWQSVSGWHEQVMTSNAIRSRSATDTEEENRRYQRCVAQRPELADFLDYHLPFYEGLIGMRAT